MTARPATAPGVRPSWRGILGDERGQASVETAFGIAALSAMLLTVVAAIAAMGTHLVAVDLVGQLARAEARGDRAAVAAVTGRLGGTWEHSVHREGDLVVAAIVVDLPVFDITAEAAALEETAGGAP